jgi:molybdate transport system substrate-binding protein
MRELAQATAVRPIGCTQVTEINNTPGVALVGVLPREFELATTYSLGVSARATVPAVARKLVGWLTGPESAALRSRAGFEIR